MKPEFIEQATKVFKLDEGDGVPGKSGEPYKDSSGYWTIGRGHFVGEHLEDLKLSPTLIEHMFIEDLDTAVREARLVVGDIFYFKLSPARQMALVTMLFTLGQNKFLKFEETIDAMRKQDWETVSMHVLHAKWARDVDPKQREGIGRDDRVAYMFKTGEYPKEYGI